MSKRTMFVLATLALLLVMLPIGSQPTAARPVANPVATDTPAITSTPAATDTLTATAVVTPTDTSVPVATPTDCPNPFVDINGNVFYYAIHYLYCAGVINGTDATHFSPAANITRAQIAKLVVTGFHVPLVTPGGQTFTDVPPGYYAYLYIESGFHASILNGYDAASCVAAGAAFPCYLANNQVTREQLAKIVFNAAGYVPATTIPHCFSFADPILDTLCAKGVIHGYPDGTFRPNNPVRRDESAAIIYKAIITP